MRDGFAGLNGMLSNRPAWIDSNVDVESAIAVGIESVACCWLQYPGGCHTHGAWNIARASCLDVCRARFNKQWGRVIQDKRDATSGKKMIAMQRERATTRYAATAA